MLYKFCIANNEIEIRLTLSLFLAMNDAEEIKLNYTHCFQTIISADILLL